MLRLRRSRGGLRRFWWILLLALGAKAAAICHPTGGFEIQKEKTGACPGSAVRYAPQLHRRIEQSFGGKSDASMDHSGHSSALLHDGG